MTLWSGVTLCPLEMNDVELAENVVIAMRNKITLKSVSEFDGERMMPAVVSTPHASVMTYNSTSEGAELITKFVDDDSEDTEARRNLAKVQTGERILLRSMSDFHLLTNPWPRSDEIVNKKNAFAAFTKWKTYSRRPEQGNCWDQYGNSSSAASA